MAFAHHNAAHGDERRGGEAELFCAEQRGDSNVAAGLQFAVYLHADAAAQIVHDEHLLGFGQAKLPGNAGMFQRRERRSAGAAVVAADEHQIGMGFRYARRHRANAHFGDQLDRDARLWIDILQIVNQLR